MGLQAEFRRQVIERDGCCIVSQAEAEDCVATHIAPYDRSDVRLVQVSESVLPSLTQSDRSMTKFSLRRVTLLILPTQTTALTPPQSSTKTITQ